MQSPQVVAALHNREMGSVPPCESTAVPTKNQPSFNHAPDVIGMQCGEYKIKLVLRAAVCDSLVTHYRIACNPAAYLSPTVQWTVAVSTILLPSCTKFRVEPS